MLSIFNTSVFAPHHTPHGMTNDLHWWTTQLSQDRVSVVPKNSEILVPSLMPAHQWALVLSLIEGGGLGDSSQVENEIAETLDGPKPWASNSKPESLQKTNTLQPTVLSHILTMLELLKDGGKDRAITDKLIKFSNLSTPPLKIQESNSIPNMLQAQTIRPTALQEAYTHPVPYYSPSLKSQSSSVNSSLILMPHFSKQNTQG